MSAIVESSPLFDPTLDRVGFPLDHPYIEFDQGVRVLRTLVYSFAPGGKLPAAVEELIRAFVPEWGRQ